MACATPVSERGATDPTAGVASRLSPTSTRVQPPLTEASGHSQPAITIVAGESNGYPGLPTPPSLAQVAGDLDSSILGSSIIVRGGESRPASEPGDVGLESDPWASMQTTVRRDDLASGITTTLWTMTGTHRVQVSPNGRRIAYASGPNLLQELPVDAGVDVDSLFMVDIVVRDLERGAVPQVVTQMNSVIDRFTWSDRSDALWISREANPDEYELDRVGLEGQMRDETQPELQLDARDLAAVYIKLLAVNEGAGRVVLDTYKPEEGREIIGYDMDRWEILYRRSAAELADLAVSPQSSYIMILDPTTDAANLLTVSTGGVRSVEFNGWLPTFGLPTVWSFDESSVAWAVEDTGGWRLLRVDDGTVRSLSPPRLSGADAYFLAGLGPDGAAALWGPRRSVDRTVVHGEQPSHFLVELLQPAGEGIPEVTTWPRPANGSVLAWIP